MDDVTKKTIIVIDDDATLGQLIVEVLNDEPDYAAVLANDAAHALEFTRSSLVNLILLDVRLPGLDGLQLYDLLQADPNTLHIPIVFMTASPKQPGLTERPNSSLIEKPFELDDLLDCVAKILRQGMPYCDPVTSNSSVD